MIESVLALLNIGLVVTVIGIALYLSFAKTWIHFSLYEGLYCLAENHPRLMCERKAFKRVDRIIPLPTGTRLQLRKETRNFIGEIKLGRTQNRTWKHSLSQRLYEYELKLSNPEIQYRNVR